LEQQLQRVAGILGLFPKSLILLDFRVDHHSCILLCRGGGFSSGSLISLSFMGGGNQITDNILEIVGSSSLMHFALWRWDFLLDL
jgi:hypothetical protein